ncbi:MAG: cation diffusion facilitator family transporter [Christensenellales bacterium]|jgi:cation diffusion facilitator family transporter
MIRFLIRKLIKNAHDTNDASVRRRYGVLSGVLGIVLNLLLFAAKLTAGLISRSVAITGDAINNLSDAGSSVIMLAGFKMAGKKADTQHPFGHGRVEYIAGFAVSLIIMLMGIELIRSSIEKILTPEAVAFNLLPFCILLASIFVKLYMYAYNRFLCKRIQSDALKATALDSLSDAAATVVVVAGMLIGHYTGWMVDGYLGVVVSLFILYTGFTTARDTFHHLLGGAPSEALVHSIEQTVLAHDEILGVHEIIVHNYGPSFRMVSLHAEADSSSDLLLLHDVIDHIEHELNDKYDCSAVIHLDPLVMDDTQTSRMLQKTLRAVQSIDPVLSIHDFRMTAGPKHTKLIFDLVVPHDFHMNAKELVKLINEKLSDFETPCFAVVCVENPYV